MTNDQKIEEIALLNFSEQFDLNVPQKDIETRIIDIMKEISDERQTNNMEPPHGLLVLFGCFYQGFDGQQIDTNPFENSYIQVRGSKFKDSLLECMQNDYDGAVLIDRHDQLLAARILVNYMPQPIAPGIMGVRHHTAQVASKFPQIISTMALSETSNKVSVYKNGKRIELYDPTTKSNG